MSGKLLAYDVYTHSDPDYVTLYEIFSTGPVMRKILRAQVPDYIRAMQSVLV